MNRRVFFALFAGAAGTAGAVKALEAAAPASDVRLLQARLNASLAALDDMQAIQSLPIWQHHFEDELVIRFAARDWADDVIARQRSFSIKHIVA